jgi:hypothetical protein
VKVKMMVLGFAVCSVLATGLAFGVTQASAGGPTVTYYACLKSGRLTQVGQANRAVDRELRRFPGTQKAPRARRDREPRRTTGAPTFPPEALRRSIPHGSVLRMISHEVATLALTTITEDRGR